MRFFFTNFLSIFFIINPTKEKSEHILEVLFLRPCDESESLKVSIFRDYFLCLLTLKEDPFGCGLGGQQQSPELQNE